MSQDYKRLLEGNQKWVSRKLEEEPKFFEEIAKGQSPKYLWIGCSDSRVPANEITNTISGEIFVHRNIANMVVPTDMNLLSVLQYAVEVLKVKHIIVCGHSECGGVKAALGKENFGLIDNWLNNIKNVYNFHKSEVDSIENYQAKVNRMIELNVINQVYNLSKTSVIQTAWAKGEFPYLHGWVYNLHNGILQDIILLDEYRNIHEIHENKHL
ncbi:MAG: carbonic anhydrase [Candidatus Sericytochromatia bacterium]